MVGYFEKIFNNYVCVSYKQIVRYTMLQQYTKLNSLSDRCLRCRNQTFFTKLYVANVALYETRRERVIFAVRTQI